MRRTRCRHCAESVRPEATVCPHCSLPLGEPETPAVQGLVRLHQLGEKASFEGLLLGVVDGQGVPHYRLANARLLVDTNKEHDVPIDGEALVPCARVAYVQKVG